VGAIDAAALGPFKKQAHGHGREKVFSILVAISLVGAISGKSLKLFWCILALNCDIWWQQF